MNGATPVTLESPLVFRSGAQRLLGILSQPAGGQPLCETAVLVVVGGPQYRAGSHRQFVQLARELSARGHAVLRFDATGMGDSEGEFPGFEHLEGDIDAALAALMEAAPDLRRVVLWGLCDGATASLLYLDARDDPRVAGLILLNPWVRTDSGQARTRVKHYYLRRLRSREFWSKLLRGQVAWGALRELGGSLVRAVRTARPAAVSSEARAALPYPERMARVWQSTQRPILLVMSGQDLTAREFDEMVQSQPEWRAALSRKPTERIDLTDADHTCSALPAKRAVEAATVRWLQHHFGSAAS